MAISRKPGNKLEKVLDQAWVDIEYLVLASEKAGYHVLSISDATYFVEQMNVMKSTMAFCFAILG